jgi:hypothetical protein
MGLELHAMSSPRGGRRTYIDNMGLELHAMSSPRGEGGHRKIKGA